MYYIDLVTHELNDLYGLLKFIEESKANGRVFAKHSRFGHGTKAKDPCEMIRKFKTDFEILQRQVVNKDFKEQYHTEMEHILSIWKAWRNPDDEYSYLENQDDFKSAMETYWQRYFTNGRRWYDGGRPRSGLKPELFLSAHDVWTLIPATVMPNQSDVIGASGSLTHQLLTRLKNI
jgi:glutamate synthase domain-containing protein 1